MPPPFDLLPYLYRGLIVTIQVTALSAAVGLVAAFTAGLALLSPFRPVRVAARVYVEVFRGTSAIVQLFWFFFALPLFGISLTTLEAAMLALGLNVGAYGAEVVRGAIMAVPRDQYDAAIALNMSGIQRLRLVILPQALVAMLPLFTNLLIELLKGSSLVSLITLHDLTFNGQILVTSTLRTTDIYLQVLVMYFVVAYALTLLMRLIERRVRRGIFT